VSQHKNIETKMLQYEGKTITWDHRHYNYQIVFTIWMCQLQFLFL